MKYVERSGVVWMVLLVAAVALPPLAHGRELGHYIPGVANIRDMAVPPVPGFYYQQYITYYSSDTYKDRNGDSVRSLNTRNGTISIDPDIDLYAITPLFIWATDRTFLGGNYAGLIAPSFADSSVSARLSTLNRTGTFGSDNSGLGDLFVQPVWLGWRDAKYEFSLGLGLYAPTGDYNEDGDDNVGLGFWTTQLQLAAYFYLDEQQASALMLAGTYEVHGSKDGTDITPGDHFTLEYGFSQYFTDRLEFGLAGFSHWQVKDDKGTTLLDNTVDTEVHGIGAQIAYWTSPRLNLSLRYSMEYDAKARTEGDWISFNLTWLPGPLF